MNYQSLVISIVLSGTLGFLNYNLLVNQGTLSSYSSKEDRSAWCILFSIMNFLIYTIIINVIANNPNIWNVVFTVLITVVTSILITFLLLRFLFNRVEILLNKSRSNENLSMISTKTPHEYAFEQHGYMMVYIFDFNHQYISSGFLEHYSESLDLEHQLLLTPEEKMEQSTFSEDEVIELMNKNYSSIRMEDYPRVYIDNKSKLKYYIFYLKK